MKNQVLVGLLVCAFAHGVCSGSEAPDLTAKQLRRLIETAAGQDEEDTREKECLDDFFAGGDAALVVAEALLEDAETGERVMEYCFNHGKKDVLSAAWQEAESGLNDDECLRAYLTVAQDEDEDGDCGRRIARYCNRALRADSDERDEVDGSGSSSEEEGYGYGDSDDD